MQIIHRKTFSEAYKALVNTLLYADEVGATKEINNCAFIVDKPQTSENTFYHRNISKDYAEAELKWYWSGCNLVDEIGKHAKMWYKLSDDGVTNNSAYGYILEKKYGFDQIQQIIELLQKDPETRRAVLNISDPAINRIETKDMQCTIALQFLIRNESLETTVYMRSNDVYFGLPYDFIYFVSIAEYIARQLGLTVGTYTHHATSMHMYLRDVEKFKTTKSSTLTLDVQKIVEDNYEK